MSQLPLMDPSCVGGYGGGIYGGGVVTSGVVQSALIVHHQLFTLLLMVHPSFAQAPLVIAMVVMAPLDNGGCF